MASGEHTHFPVKLTTSILHINTHLFLAQVSLDTHCFNTQHFLIKLPLKIECVQCFIKNMHLVDTVNKDLDRSHTYNVNALQMM